MKNTEIRGMKMENIIRNITTGQTDGKNTGIHLAKKIASENQKKTGNLTYVRRILDNTDTYSKDGETWKREHFSFDVYELV